MGWTKPKTKACKTCGTEFAAASPNARYCSPECRPSYKAPKPASAPEGGADMAPEHAIAPEPKRNGHCLHCDDWASCGKRERPEECARWRMKTEGAKASGPVRVATYEPKPVQELMPATPMPTVEEAAAAAAEAVEEVAAAVPYGWMRKRAALMEAVLGCAERQSICKADLKALVREVADEIGGCV